jgi:hypothetical protein
VGSKLTAIGLSVTWLILGAEVSVASADGGAVRYSERHDDRLITVFTDPTPVRAGIVDVSVLIQDANSGKPLPDVAVTVSAYPIHNLQGRISSPATTESATNKLLQSAQLDLSESGPWRIELAVEALGKGSPIGFEVDVAEARPPWMQTSFWIGWPVAVIGLFVIHQFLVRRGSLKTRRASLSRSSLVTPGNGLR